MQLQYVQLITVKITASDMSGGLFTISVSVSQTRYPISQCNSVKASTDRLLFIIVQSIVILDQHSLSVY